MISYALLTVANFVYIFLKAFQQKNVIGGHYGLAAATNMFLVATEMFVMGSIALAAVTAEWEALGYTFIALTIGGGSGCITAMWLHTKHVRKKDATV